MRARVSEEMECVPPAGSDELSHFFGHTERMASVEKVMAELQSLTPDQLERVTRFIHEITSEGPGGRCAGSSVSNSVVQEATQNGWPSALFTKVIGRIDEDFERPPQLPYEVRRDL
jgi:hypothetical protein